jgi:hypothetical protein
MLAKRLLEDRPVAPVGALTIAAHREVGVLRKLGERG